ncbi:MAG TPA: hypothetical protein PLB51_00840 [Candidatus Paceibacterota bacterium]|nr:hypothetical protein [Candidatus Paceibacterota bacterium]
MEKSDKIFLWIIGLSVVAVILATGYNFLFVQKYNFYVEAPCDPATQTCFERDCSEVDACPPNNLSTYRAFYIQAGDFSRCEDNSCLKECTSGTLSCEEIVCGDADEDICTDTASAQNTEIAPVETMQSAEMIQEGETQ